MKVNRQYAACTVFEGKIVVSGGLGYSKLKSVEVYDHYENKWSYYPDMLEARHGHSAVSMNNKMFIIGGIISNNSCEVFESFTRMFTVVKFQFSFFENDSANLNVSIGNKIYFFANNEAKVVMICSYDVEQKVFSFKTCLEVDNTENFCCTKVPMY